MAYRGYPMQGIPVAGQGRGRTIVVAASDSLDPTLAPPEYRCDGTDDQVEINAAITALGATGGAVALLEGTFAITAPVSLNSNVALMGQGAGTVLRVPDGHNANLDVIFIDSPKHHVLITNLKIDGNEGAQAAGTMHGIHFGPAFALVYCYSKVVNCWIADMRNSGIYIGALMHHNTIEGNTVSGCVDDGIYLDTTDDNTISNNMCVGNGWCGIDLYISNGNAVCGNSCYGNTPDGITTSYSSDNAITGNTCNGNDEDGISLEYAPNNGVVGNICQGNGMHGISLINTANSNNVSSNTCVENSQTTDNTYDGIFIESSDYNLIIGNVCRRGDLANKSRYGINVSNDACDRNCLIGNDLYDSGTTGDLNDVPTTNPTLKHDNRDLAGTGWLPEV